MDGGKLTLVARKPCFGLPTACPKCLPAYIYLKFAKVPFDLDFNLLDPDSERIPYVESGGYVAYNNEKGGVIEGLKDDGVVDLDSRVEFEPDWLSANAVITSWLTDAVMYELWVASDESPVHKIYYSDLARPIGKIMFLKQSRAVKQLLGVNGDNADHREKEIYRRATRAYKALSSRLGDETFFFDSRPTSVDANFLAHALFTLQALPCRNPFQNLRHQTRKAVIQAGGQDLRASLKRKKQKKKKLSEEEPNISWAHRQLRFLFF
uniref:Metaxin n=1 Tax=Kalanchoe fedtschenkoi TaxID=63787 RepID=A0A7N0TH69_KALFE